MSNFNLILGSTIVILTSYLIYFITRLKQGETLKKPLIALLILLVITLTNNGILFFFENDVPPYWIYSSIISALSSVSLAIYYYLQEFTNIQLKDTIPTSSLLTSLLISLIGFILMGTNMLDLNNTKSDAINLDLIENSIDNVKMKFNEIDDIITNESHNINKIFSEIEKELDAKNQKLEDIQKRESNLIEQIEYYKNLSSLTEKQANSVVKTLTQDANKENIISFFIGFLASFLVWLITQMNFFKKIFEFKTN
ncbi:hypothetical protein [Ancylomarina sp.]|uniref:hypothetical protein n=1 Tax=Ancylomarina sp. TaxID=1970196 RepID=UPI0035669EC1